MTPKDDVCRLIQSLNKNEKRYHRLRMAMYATDNKTLQLFDAYCAPNAQESVIKQQFSDATFVRNFATHKHLLYKQVLKSLHEFRAGKSPPIDVAEKIRQVELLHERGLNKQAVNLANKARKLALKHNLLPQLLDLFDVERRLLENSAAAKQIEHLQELAKQQTEYLQIFENLNQYSVLRTRLTILRKTTMRGSELSHSAEMQELLQHELLADESRALSDSARILFNRIKGEAAIAMAEYQQAVSSYTRLFELWAASDVPALNREKSQVNNTLLPKEYRTDLVNFLNLTAALQLHVEVADTLEKLRRIQPQNLREQSSWFQDVAHIELLHYMQTGQLEKGKQTIQTVQKGISKVGSSLSTSRVLTLRINSALLCFLAGDFNAALYWINEIEDQPGRELRQDIRVFTHLLALILHFELGNYSLFESLARSGRRRLKQAQVNDGFEECIIKHLTRLARQPAPGHKPKDFKLMADELAQIRIDLGRKIPPGFEAAATWVHSRLNGITIDVEFRQALKVVD